MAGINTYDSALEAEADRSQQKALLVALNAWPRALRRDECGAWCIGGEHGTVHTWGDGKTWALYVACRSTRHWTATKRCLAFCEVTQDGDAEGCLRLLALPTPGQAEIIRGVLGIRKRMEYAPEDLERRRASMSKLFPAQASANATAPLPQPIQKEVPVLEAEPAK